MARREQSRDEYTDLCGDGRLGRRALARISASAPPPPRNMHKHREIPTAEAAVATQKLVAYSPPVLVRNEKYHSPMVCP